TKCAHQELRTVGPNTEKAADSRKQTREGWPTHVKLHLLPGGITRSESVGFHQVLQIRVVGFKLPLDHPYQERLRQLEEAAWFRDMGVGDPCPTLNALEGPPALHWDRPRFAFLCVAVVRLVLGDLHFAFHPPTQKREDSSVGGTHANGSCRRDRHV